MEQVLEIWNKVPLALKFLALLLLWAGLGAGYYFFIFSEQEVAYKRQKKTFLALRKKRLKHEIIARNRGIFKKEVGRLRRRLTAARKLLPNQKEISALLRSIDDTARSSGLQMISFRPRKESREGVYARLPMALVVRGSFFELMRFFDKVRQMKRIVSVSGLTLNAGKLNNQKVLLNSNFSLTTYRYLKGGKKKRRRKRRRRRR